MTKLVLDDIANVQVSETTINNNSQKIEDEFEKVLYRDNPYGIDNSMLNDLDMNSNDIFNANNVSSSAFTLNGTTLLEWGITGGGTISGTPAQIKTLYEINPDTNAFTDADEAKLDALDDGGSVKTFGAVGDGATDDSAAFIAALASGLSVISVPAGKYVISETIEIPAGVTLQGEGIDFWEDSFKNADNLKKEDKGTHLHFTGTGGKLHTISNLNGVQTGGGLKTAAGLTPTLTDFSNADSASGTSATPKAFSCAVILNETSQLKNLRVMANHTGISGYNDFTSTTLSDEWDVGLWCKSANHGNVDNVQIVGHWRFGGTLVTENSGNWTEYGNSERLHFNNVYSNGVRGLILRNTEQIRVISATSSSVTIPDTSSLVITGSSTFKLNGGGIDSSIVFSYTSVTAAAGEITLNGVSPALAGTPSLLRPGNQGTGFAGTSFENCLFTGMEHPSRATSQSFGLRVSGAAEISGFPLRGVKFDNTKFQVRDDSLNTFFGDVRDLRLSNCQLENGESFALDISEAGGYTGNLRMDGTILTAGRDGFTPRDAYLDMEQFPTQFTDGTFTIKPWRAENLVLENGAGTESIQLLHNTDDVVIKGNSFQIKNPANTNLMTVFSTGNVDAAGNVNPETTGVYNLGVPAKKWLNVDTDTITLGTDSKIQTGTGTPEGVVAATVGNIFIRTDGGVGSTVYSKESGVGNTGWVAFGASGGGSYTLPIADTGVLGGVLDGTDINIDAFGNVSVVDDSHNHIIANVDGLQTELDTKASLTSGTWTPEFKFVSVPVYASQVGEWERIGDTVFCRVFIEYASLDITDTSPFTLTIPTPADVSHDTNWGWMDGSVEADQSTCLRMGTTPYSLAVASGGSGVEILVGETAGLPFHNLQYSNSKVLSSGSLILTFNYKAA